MIQTFHPLCSVTDIAEDSSKGFSIDGIDLLAVNKHGKVHVYYNQCPHLRLPLEWQTDQFLNDDYSLIQCATHGALFDIVSGRCVYGPCQGQSLQQVENAIADNIIYVNISAFG